MEPTNSLTGASIYIVTGASSGIGRSTAFALAQCGHRVLAVARREKLLKDLVQTNPNLISAVTADLGTTDGIDRVARAAGSAKRVLGLVHAAGTPVALADYQQTNTNQLITDLAVHVVAPMALNNQLDTLLDGAKLLYIDSYSASTPRIGWASYSIIKAAAQMAARTAAAELTKSTVVRVFPGGVRTPLVDAVLNGTPSSPTVQTFKALEANGELAEPSEIGTYICAILTRAKPDELRSRETWDFNNPADHPFN